MFEGRNHIQRNPKRMKYIELLASYVPTNIVNTLLEDDKLDMPPQRKHYYAACLFADVSGFTALNEQMTIDYGPDAGAEKDCQAPELVLCPNGQNFRLRRGRRV